MSEKESDKSEIPKLLKEKLEYLKEKENKEENNEENKVENEKENKEEINILREKDNQIMK